MVYFLDRESIPPHGCGSVNGLRGCLTICICHCLSQALCGLVVTYFCE